MSWYILQGTAAATGFPATAYAVEAAKIWSADISPHRSQPLTVELIDRSDMILAMTVNHCRDIIGLQPDAAPKTFFIEKLPGTGLRRGRGRRPYRGVAWICTISPFIEIGEELGRILPDIVEKARQLALKNEGAGRSD